MATDSSKKTTADFAKYFQTTFQAPNLKEARRRRKNRVQHLNDFNIPEDIKGIGKGKKFLIRTYGCQMNEHDTEVMAGIFEEIGYTSTEVDEEADIILLNTCAIRENAENKVFGEIGHLKHLKREKPELILGVCGCMAQEEAVVNKILQKHRHV
ncbi:MAG TPA: tRNA (N6-isopentenyl adenosine(37)-C2)-methylthiotransferase MiaB, partial [Bacillales bacterium]|nr:tRNA (N6-isopentenyl adenosine(37)-C2)-methylthiotransferase MiaB [Bacillales bacterium]